MTAVVAEDKRTHQDIAEIPLLFNAIILAFLGQGHALGDANVEGDHPGRLLGPLTHLVAVALQVHCHRGVQRGAFVGEDQKAAYFRTIKKIFDYALPTILFYSIVYVIVIIINLLEIQRL